MSWVAVGLGVGGAVLGGMGSERKRQQTEAFNKGQAEVTRYSPWTGLHGNVTQNNNDWFGGALQGGLSGAMMGQSLGKAGAAKPEVPTSNPVQGADGYGASPLGGDQMAAQLGDVGNQSAYAGFDNNPFQKSATNRYALLGR